MDIYQFFIEVLQGVFSLLSLIEVGSSSFLGVTVAAILLGMLIRSFVVTSK